MVDMDAYMETFPDRRPKFMGSTSDGRTWVSDCTCSVCNQRRKTSEVKKSTAIFNAYQGLPPKTMDKLEDEQYLLLPSQIYAYVFRTRTWG